MFKYITNRVVNNETTHIYVFAGDKEILNDYCRYFQQKKSEIFRIKIFRFK